MSPATAARAPTTLTAALVAIPAKSSATPNERTMGHAVGAGTAMVAGEVSAARDDTSKAMLLSSPQRPMT